MSRTLGALVSEVRVRLDEATTTFWTDPQIRGWILEGLRDVSRRSETLQQPTTITVAAGIQDYTLPSDCIRIYRVEWQASGSSSVYTLEYGDLNSMDSAWGTAQKLTQSFPQTFTLWGFPPTLSIKLWPIPSQAGTLNAYYYRLPADLSTSGAQDNVVVDIPEGWWDCVVDYAEYMALRKDRDPRWAEAKGLYEQKLEQMIDITRRWTDQSDAIQYRGSTLPAWLYGGY